MLYGIGLFILGALLYGLFKLTVWIAKTIYQVYLSAYFNSDAFKVIKSKVSKHTDDCNALNKHIDDLKHSYVYAKSFDYGQGVLSDHSNYKIKRKNWSENTQSNQVYNCSALICKNANNQPFKYLCKYFDIKIDEETLVKFEGVLNDFAAVEQGKALLLKERSSIIDGISDLIPPLIMRYSKQRLMDEIGLEHIDITDLYVPNYTFQYVSPGGNSSMQCNIKFNVENLDKFIFYLADLVKFRKSVAGQRALMTSSLREKIKNRDNNTCQMCSLSIADEKNLLLEIDHIVPLSKGGVTTEDNLQTLCWKCNRSKGSKLLQ